MDTFEIKRKIEKFQEEKLSKQIKDYEGSQILCFVINDFLNKIITNIDQLQKEMLKWSIEDFMYQARLKEGILDIPVEDLTIKEAKKILKKYDPEKFQDALETMIHKHDAEIGITWDTISDYLEEYCLIDK